MDDEGGSRWRCPQAHCLGAEGGEGFGGWAKEEKSKPGGRRGIGLKERVELRR